MILYHYHQAVFSDHANVDILYEAFSCIGADIFPRYLLRAFK